MNKEKQFFEQSNSSSIQNNDFFRNWLFDYNNVTREEFDDRHLILKNNKKHLLEKIGRQNFCTSDSAGRRLYCWKINISDKGYLWIITAPERGTSIEYEILNTEDSADFYNESQTKIRELFDLNIL